jgi:hypothetical protein
MAGTAGVGSGSSTGASRRLMQEPNARRDALAMGVARAASGSHARRRDMIPPALDHGMKAVSIWLIG